MARKQTTKPKHKFGNKLVLNQWLISLFGIDTFQERTLHGRKVRPFHVLSDPIKSQDMEGIVDNEHRFFYNLIRSDLFYENNQ